VGAVALGTPVRGRKPFAGGNRPEGGPGRWTHLCRPRKICVTTPKGGGVVSRRDLRIGRTARSYDNTGRGPEQGSAGGQLQRPFFHERRSPRGRRSMLPE